MIDKNEFDKRCADELLLLEVAMIISKEHARIKEEEDKGFNGNQ